MKTKFERTMIAVWLAIVLAIPMIPKVLKATDAVPAIRQYGEANMTAWYWHAVAMYTAIGTAWSYFWAQV